MRGTTMDQRRQAAAHAAQRRSASVQTPAGRARANAIVGIPGGTPALTMDQLYFSGVYPDYANSPLPNLNDTINCGPPNFCGMRKFVDTLPLPGVNNDLGNQMPVGVPDTTTFPGSDYYEISLVQYRQQLHKDLPAVSGSWPSQTGGTLLRGYVQTNAPLGSPALIPSYLGPLIVAQSNRPVRVKFTNALPTGTAGNLFIPTDLTALGAGLGMPTGNATRYLQNRATVHLHGGNTPWISDGTPHQWTIPAGDWANTNIPRGASVSFVPDMFFRTNGTVVPQCSTTVTTNCSDAPGMNGQLNLPAGSTNDPGHGALTFYYTNQQSGRLMFYHDHAYGTTRLNVYAGEAGGYLLTDAFDADLTNGTNNTGVFTGTGVATAPVLPAEQIPLVIQDKTFVPQNPASTTISSVAILENGAGYTQALTSVSFTGGCTTEPVATPVVGDMVDPFGQYITGTVTGFTFTSYGSGCTSDPIVTITGDGTGAAAFASVATLSQEDPTWDSAAWGGYGNLWYPHVYITNQWPDNPDGSGVNPMGRWDYASWFWPPFNGTPGQFTVRGDISCPTAAIPNQVCPGFPTVFSPAPVKEIDGSVHLGQGSTVSLTPEGFMDTPLINGVAYPVLNVDPKPYRFRILSVANERTFNLSWFLACDAANTQYTPTIGAVCPAADPGTASYVTPLSEVGMVPAATTAGFPPQWPSDGRAGGVPDPAAMGPDWIQIGSEGGILPAPSVIHPTPITYETNMRSVTVTNISNHGLLLMSAERADAIVDFTAYAGKTLILYNDAPAPAPAHDDRNDYYTGDADNTGTGGAPTTLAGFGPNTRTIMQVVVAASVTGQAEPAVNMANLNKVIPAAFRLSQPPPVVPEPTYNAAYGDSFKAVYPTLHSTSLSFTPIDPATLKKAIDAVTKLPITVSLDIRFKTIQELFDLDYGRMNATLGTELPLTNYNTQTTVPLGYVDPFTEDLYDSSNVSGMPVGTAADGSQIWIIVHNGVDSHAIHFHLYDVQLINRYGWDGTNRPPFPNELGWKDTVRMNPLEMDFVALRPMRQNLPFPVPDSRRMFDVTRPAGSDVAMSNVDPINGAAPQRNQMQSMGWEYVWHCHLLGHEENDMMREQVFQVAPETPVNISVVRVNPGGGTYRNRLTFTDMALSESGFDVQRSTSPTMSNPTLIRAVSAANAGWKGSVTWTDPNVVSNPIGTNPQYYYQVRSFKLDADYWTPIIGPLSGPNQGNPTTLPHINSPWSAVGNQTPSPIIGWSPASLTFGSQALGTTSSAQSVTVTSNGTVNLLLTSVPVIAGTNAGDFALTSTCPLTPSPLAPGATCTVGVTFTPTYPGTRTASLVIQSNGTGNNTVTIPLTGTSPTVPLTITASSTSIAWGSAKPTITPIPTGLVGGDTIANLGALTCTTTYTVTSNVGTYPSTCSGAVNSAYAITYVPGTVTVNATTASMISPVPGSILPGANVTFTWDTGGKVQLYNLMIGWSGPGSKQYYYGAASGALSANVTGLPTDGSIVYVRLQTQVNGVWLYKDYTYTKAGTPAPSTLVSPAPGSQVLQPGPVTFTWTPGNGVSMNSLTIGSAPGTSNYYKVQNLVGTTSVTVSGLPQTTVNPPTLYVRLSSMVNGVWQYIDYTVLAY